MKYIRRRDGEEVNFELDRLEKSLIRAGTRKKTAKDIATTIFEQTADGDTTESIYRKAFELLKEKEERSAMQYSLRRALFDLGPTGFPFEKFVAQLYKRLGYKTVTNIEMQGRCSHHEVDVYARGKENIAMEVKFHNNSAIRTDLKTLLYVKSRFDDLKTSKSIFKKHKHPVSEGLLVSNTKFTSTAINYAKCAGVQIMGWGYPEERNLQTLIKEVNAHPVTCLPSISTNDKKTLFENGITTCTQIIEQIDSIDFFKPSKKAEVLREAELLCNPRSRI